ncbi:MAG: bifunctional phosphoribosylaminoimidazolecarboxamide formyltransferase/IMP cyclohydrolase, partial [Elusimicrobiales bacterium]
MKTAIFASGNGTNFANLVELEKMGYLKSEISFLITDRRCGAEKKAEGFLLPVLRTKDEHQIIKELERRNIDFIVLAGYLSKIGENILKRFEGRVINIHPALLPSFGGRGFYGQNVHRSVFERGVKVSGITIHFADREYDSGKIIFQKTINITPKDTPSTIEEKIHKLEYFYYPFVLNMIFEGIIKLQNSKVIFDSSKKTSSKHALFSLTDKDGAVEFAKKLNSKGYLIICTAGTYKLLVENGIKCVGIESITGFDEIMDGRVKTLNNAIFAGILAIRNNEKHIREMNELFIPSVDIVVVNLYDFKNASVKMNAFDDELMENIDIGGVSLLRAAAKNWKDVIVICDKDDYQKVIEEIENPSDELKKSLSAKAFAYTAEYDSMIAEKLSFKNFISITAKKIFDLRYGENPHQKASFYSASKKLPFKQLWGKELSYNNILDAYESWQAVCDFEKPACVIFKHTTPCGIATDDDITIAFEKAYICDPISAFGGIIAINRKITQNIAVFLSGKFIEIISAPDFEESAIEILKRKKNLRILKWAEDIRNHPIIRNAGSEIMITEPDNIILSDRWDVVGGEIDEREKNAAIFAFTCVK